MLWLSVQIIPSILSIASKEESRLFWWVIKRKCGAWINWLHAKLNLFLPLSQVYSSLPEQSLSLVFCSGLPKFFRAKGFASWCCSPPRRFGWPPCHLCIFGATCPSVCFWSLPSAACQDITIYQLLNLPVANTNLPSICHCRNATLLVWILLRRFQFWVSDCFWRQYS